MSEFSSHFVKHSYSRLAQSIHFFIRRSFSFNFLKPVQTEGGSMLRPELRPQYLVRFVPNAKQKILGVLFVAFESSM